MRTLSSLPQRFEKQFRALARIGRDPQSKGYHRYAWTEEDRAARQWFQERAEQLGLYVEQDRNGNLWAWWGNHEAPGAIVTGSHLDTVPNGGAYDGALGVVSGFLAIDELRRSGFQPKRPLAVVAFADEEGARFGVATVGSRLMTGALRPNSLLRKRDVDRVSVAEAVRPFGVDPEGMGHDPERIARISSMVELHVEQGRRLGPIDAPIGIGTEIWPHGRWHLRVEGEANHAGTTMPEDRRDPTQVLGMVIGAARLLTDGPEAFATFGRIIVEPNGTNVIPARVDAWLDARAAHEDDLDIVVMGVKAVAEGVAERHGLKVKLTCESLTPGVYFDRELRERIIGQLGCPEIPTGAGHDAGALSSVVPTAMLFVRNPTGVSHSPTESAETDDCVKGITALAAILANLAGVAYVPPDPVSAEAETGDQGGAEPEAEEAEVAPASGTATDVGRLDERVVAAGSPTIAKIGAPSPNGSVDAGGQAMNDDTEMTDDLIDADDDERRRAEANAPRDLNDVGQTLPEASGAQPQAPATSDLRDDHTSMKPNSDKGRSPVTPVPSTPSTPDGRARRWAEQDPD